MWAGRLKHKSGGMVDIGSVRFITYFYIPIADWEPMACRCWSLSSLWVSACNRAGITSHPLPSLQDNLAGGLWLVQQPVYIHAGSHGAFQGSSLLALRGRL